jgi:glycogen debranching enzyme
MLALQGLPNVRSLSAPNLLERQGIHLDALVRVLCEIGRVEHLADLGRNGPLLASAGRRSLFHCLFGRDALRMALDLLEDFPSVAHATLFELARLQGVTNNPRGDEEPGRILHEFRHPDDPHAIRLSEAGWDFPYYGAVDTTPQWINLLGAYCARYGNAILDETLTDRLWRSLVLRDALLSALAWIVGRMDDPIGGGYLWVRRASPRGIANQVWEDSHDSHYHANGALFDVNRPYAPIAVQGYTYDALLTGADLLAQAQPDGLAFDPAWLRKRAARLRAQVLADFWQADLGTFAQALTVEADGSLRAARVVASSAGHLLDGYLLAGDDAAEQRAALAARFGQHDLLAGGGIRTKSTEAPRFRAGAYHNGSTWPMDSGVIADGLRRWGQIAAADDVEQRILDGCRLTGGFPEFLRGDVDGRVAVNTRIVDALVDGTPNRLEQPPQANQGWTATRVWRILRRRGAVDLA